jgi:hypothetical protein
MGQSTQIGQHRFVCDEQIMLPASDMELKFAEEKEYWVQTCDGEDNRAAITESFLLVPDAHGIGWVRTLGKPFRYAGVNLPNGETNMAKPTSGEIANVVNRAFAPTATQEVTKAQALSDKEYKPLWKIFAWIIIVILLVEPAVANKLKR